MSEQQKFQVGDLVQVIATLNDSATRYFHQSALGIVLGPWANRHYDVQLDIGVYRFFDVYLVKVSEDV